MRDWGMVGQEGRRTYGDNEAEGNKGKGTQIKEARSIGGQTGSIRQRKPKKL
jgi:hypothetical protein